MKLPIKKFGLLTVMLLTTLHVSSFEVDGLNYSILSDSTVGVYGASSDPSLIEEIVIPDKVAYQNTLYSVSAIEDYAFSYCSSLQAVSFPESLEYIGDLAFYSCSLQSVSFPESLEYIGDGAFERCSSLQVASFPESLEYIRDEAFCHCSLQSVSFPESLDSIGFGAFAFNNINNVELSNGIKRIGAEAFRYSDNSLYLHLPPSIEYVGSEIISDGAMVLYCGNVQLGDQRQPVDIVVLDTVAPTIIGSTSRFPAKLYLVNPDEFLLSNDYPGDVISIGEFGKSGHEFVYRYDGTSQPLLNGYLNSYSNLQPLGLDWYCSDFDVQNAGCYSGNATIEVKHNDWSNSFSIPYAFEILKADLSIAINDCEKTYGDENPAFSFVATGFKGDDNWETSITDIGYKTAADINSDVGSYVISMTAESNNYNLKITEGHLNITKAPLTVTAENVERMYGESNPSFTCAYTGLKLSDTEDTAFSTLPTLSCAATLTSNVGEYPIAVSGGTANNYEIVSYENGVLSVAKAPLTLIANDKSRLYFEENPTFDYTLSGLRNSDTESCLTTQPTFKCSATKTSDAGEYVIEPSDASAQNYTFEYQAGSLMVNQRELTASVGNYTRIYGTDNPDFVVTYNGFVNDENESVLTTMADASCLANQDSDVGVYPINISGGEALNYIITKYNSGTLTIEKADQTLTWDQDLSDVQQYSQVALEATSSSGLPVSYEMSPNNVATLYNNAGTWYLDCYGIGAVNIRAIQNGDKNYNAAPILTKTLVVIGDGGIPSNPSIFLNVENAGTLPSLIAENRKYQIKNLRLTGYLNGTDINFLREMAGSDCDGNMTSGILEILDISGSTIVSGGRSYYKSCYTSNYKIGDYMFYNCKALANIMLPDNTTEIEDYAFADCSKLSVISIPNGVNSFGEQSFRNDISLQRVPMPNSLTSIGDYAFIGCNGITEITLPSNVRYIGDGIMKDCQNIARINVEAGNSYFASDNGVLYTSALNELLIFPVNYNSSVYTVVDEATRIAPYAFVNANKLTDVILPSSLLTIGQDAFIGCVNLSSINVKALNPPICDNDCFETVSKSQCELIVPRGCYSYYWVAPVWSEFSKIREFENSVNVAEVSSDVVSVFAEERNIVIKGMPIGVQVCIFQMNGTLVYRTQSDGNEVLYQPASMGTYLVIVDNKTYKVLIR